MCIYDKDKICEYIVNKIRKFFECDEFDYDIVGKIFLEVIEYLGKFSFMFI